MIDVDDEDITYRLSAPSTDVVFETKRTESVTRAVRVAIAEVSPELGLILVAPSTTIDSMAYLTAFCSQGSTMGPSKPASREQVFITLWTSSRLKVYWVIHPVRHVQLCLNERSIKP